MEECVRCGAPVDMTKAFWTEENRAPYTGFICDFCIEQDLFCSHEAQSIEMLDRVQVDNPGSSFHGMTGLVRDIENGLVDYPHVEVVFLQKHIEGSVPFHKTELVKIRGTVGQA